MTWFWTRRITGFDPKFRDIYEKKTDRKLWLHFIYIFIFVSKVVITKSWAGDNFFMLWWDVWAYQCTNLMCLLSLKFT